MSSTTVHTRGAGAPGASAAQIDHLRATAEAGDGVAGDSGGAETAVTTFGVSSPRVQEADSVLAGPIANRDLRHVAHAAERDGKEWMGATSMEEEGPERALFGHRGTRFVRAFERGGVFAIHSIDHATDELRNQIEVAMRTGRLRIGDEVIEMHPDAEVWCAMETPEPRAPGLM